MFRLWRISVCIIVMTFASHGQVMALTSDSDTVAEPKRNIVEKFLHYFQSSNKKAITSRPNFSVIGGPHYSSEKGLGLGIVVGGLYSTCPSDSLLPVSNISLVGNIATKGFYMLGLRGVHVYPDNARRINYDLSFELFSTYFWGIGYDWGNDNKNKVKYNQLKLRFTADYEWRLAPKLYVGPATNIVYIRANDLAWDVPWQGEALGHASVGVGGRIQYDTRDNLTAPNTGMLLEAIQLFYPRFTGNGNYSFSSFEIGGNFYTPIWKGGILAMRAHGLFTTGKTPWGMLPTIGGGTIRSYYEGRYRDKNEIDITVELRQHVWRRSGIVIWAGGASVFPKISEMRSKELLPDFGFGYRWEFKQNCNVRIDLGFGKHSTGFLFGLNEAF